MRYAIMRSRKWQIEEGIEIPNHEGVGKIEKKKRKITSSLEVDTIKQAEIKGKKKFKIVSQENVKAIKNKPRHKDQLRKSKNRQDTAK